MSAREQSDSLRNRLALAILALGEAEAAVGAVADEAAITPKQRASVHRCVGTLSGMAEAFGIARDELPRVRAS